MQQPTCDKIRVYPASGDVPLDVDVSCDTTNETSVSIACGNGQTINGKTGTCNYATVGTFYPVCTVNNSITSPTCQTTVKVRKPAPDISIKKYAKEISASGDTQTAPIAVARGEYFNYYYQLQNTGSIAATYVVVKDTLPAYLTFSGQVTIRNPAGADVTADWACTQGSQVFTGETIARITLVCIKATPLPANSGLYTFTVPVVLAANAPVAVNMQNVVYVCADNMVGNPTGPKGEVICGNLNPPPPPPPNQCTPTNNPQKDPACIVTTGSGPDLSIKKYAKEISASGDTQSAPISIARGEAFNYYYTLTVASNQSSTFVDNVVVKDTLPEYVTFNGSIKIQDGLV